MPRVEQQVEQQHQEVDAVQELFDQPIERVVADDLMLAIRCT